MLARVSERVGKRGAQRLRPGGSGTGKRERMAAASAWLWGDGPTGPFFQLISSCLLRVFSFFFVMRRKLASALRLFWENGTNSTPIKRCPFYL
ncbi:hypothetical protein PAHAL_7G322900 [Panicum hallii]|jgi:hypothetical protein|uniref:Uncharacterized protein n=1 Tax=Panicum hallii TaxID=206008 RepID=A0A2T8IE66_9POAL|nr:hypothetical protein PAHAL_7G322900 [Panicum hallii]